MRELCRDLYQVCPGCGLPVNTNDDLHHALIRRDKNRPELDVPMNLILVHHNCHVPEAKNMRYNSYVMILRVWGSEAIEAWVDSLPYKVKPVLPEGYYQARMEVEGR